MEDSEKRETCVSAVMLKVVAMPWHTASFKDW